jgi:hypothetical protein
VSDLPYPKEKSKAASEAFFFEMKKAVKDSHNKFLAYWELVLQSDSNCISAVNRDCHSARASLKDNNILKI